MKRLSLTIGLFLLFAATGFAARQSATKSPVNEATFSGLKFRNIGPAFTSGRIGDFAVNPDDFSEYYVAVASGHIWKTENHGVTWKPVFDRYGSYAIGCVVMDPNNSHVVWAGTGENNSQRALGYGDGVYKTTDGGRSWKNMGLKESRQIGEILIDPRDSDVVYVAAEGSVWGPGGERGLYKTTDGGKTWSRVLEISEHTGVSDLAMDPRDPDVIYAASHQRRRHVFTKINGGPESRIYKTVDGGKTWTKLTSGLPGGDVGAIGLAISPVNPDYVYAIIEAAGNSGGFFRTTNRGASWEKMSSYVSGSPQYYNEIFCDPKDVDKVYSMDVYTRVTTDGGKTWNVLGNDNRHVDDHALWINPNDTRHLLIGGDGGVYESWDGGSKWDFKANLPVTQFYRVAVDNSEPFYWVYGGTQDNNSMGGPSRNLSSQGVVNDEWIVTNGGDGFWSQIDPLNPDIVYAESQYAGMVRYDKKSGESISIQPQPRKGEYTYRWNWDTPLIISPHSHTRLYCAAEKVFRSEDRGDTWQVISDDLTRQIDRNKLPVMGKVWSVDAVAKNTSTSLYGTIVSLVESRVREDLLYAGTDDGLIQVTEDAGQNWTKIASFPGVPEFTYVSDICASKHDANVVFAAFNNHKEDDFKPYILKSENRGRSWKSIAANLPERGSVWTIEQDHINPDLLFVGTEFGFFVSIDGGGNWVQMKNGLPVIPIRDIAIQERENDLVLASFGRGFFILDDYTPLRAFDPDILKKDAHIFPVKKALAYMQTRARYGQGSNYFAAPNPEYGAVFTFYLKESLQTLEQIRKQKESKLDKEGKPIPYPDWDELRAEAEEENPRLIFTIEDEEGSVVRRLSTGANKGLRRFNWDLTYPSTAPVRVSGSRGGRTGGRGGFMVMPGTYRVSIAKKVRGTVTHLAGPEPFEVVSLNNTTLPAPDRKAMVEFQKKVSELTRLVQGAMQEAENLNNTLAHIKAALYETPGATPEMTDAALKMESELSAIQLKLTGDRIIARNSENPPTSIASRMRTMAYTHYRSTSAVTQTEKDAYEIVKEEMGPLYARLKQLIEVDLKKLEAQLEAVHAPYTPGRLDEWKY
ncbi:MAG TPA: glycosyl hydrolase [bacterium]|nr:glycosyl hydrolase [bacterium]